MIPLLMTFATTSTASLIPNHSISSILNRSVTATLALPIHPNPVLYQTAAGASKKTEAKKKDKIIEDETFGLKNKKGAKTQKFVQQVGKQVKSGEQHPLLPTSKKDEMEKKLQEQKEMNALFSLYRPVQTQNVKKGTDPKSVVCTFFKDANCGKGGKCKYSHDLSVERNWGGDSSDFGDSAMTDQNAKDQSKRPKLNFPPSSEFSGNQGYASTHENSTPNDILAPHTNYQKFDIECNNAASSSCTNNLSNQTNTYQYTQPQSYNHQPQQQQPQSAFDPIDSTNYFQAPVSLPSYKSSHSNEIMSKNHRASSRQSFLHPFKNHHHQIICKYFLYAVEKSKYGCLAWKKRKIQEKKDLQAKEEEQKRKDYKSGKQFGFSGREMFSFKTPINKIDIILSNVKL
ncbi:zinc finger CCCH domain-containing protein 15 homolog [Sitodiplosis mosellana]|uniref:zinc finger CCCH domain-containing protein 15 homolog n=1 Tax=Sitodiplosis mosellana TaxID=263140 RepID=UPI002444C7C2|nr:zinc finger CCCH domain-containing protein 15 homolog [Sitodiplosis mosellana]